MEKIDCFAYRDRGKCSGCKALKRLYCKEEKCEFYRNDINEAEIERDIREYAIVHNK